MEDIGKMPAQEGEEGKQQRKRSNWNKRKKEYKKREEIYAANVIRKENKKEEMKYQVKDEK